MKTFEIVKRNRKYFAAKIDGKIPCKILIDENSNDLIEGVHQLEVDDISVRSKYGTDLIFKLSESVKTIADAGITTLKTNFYNRNLIDECHKLGGKWDGDEKAWVFSGLVSDKVDELDEKYNSKPIAVELTFNSELYEYGGPVTLAGFEIAKAYGRDSGAKLANGIALIEGGITSGGSMKNWKTIVKEGSVIRMTIPEKLLDDIDTESVSIKTI